MKPSRKIIIGNILLLVISVSLVLLIGELGIRGKIRAWPFEEETVVNPYLTEKDRILRWRAPAGNGRNSLGLKNREIGKKEARHFRIMVLGDSLIDWGETSSGETHTRVVELALNDTLKTVNNQIEVINAGLVAYTTYQELEFLKIHGLDMQPDLVVLGFVFNDVYLKYLHKPTASGGPVVPEAFLHQFNPQSFPGVLFAHSYLAHWSHRQVQKIISQHKGRDFPFEDRLDFYLAWKEYAWPETEKLIGEMHALLASRNIPLMIAAFPLIEQVDDQFLDKDREYVLYPQRRLRAVSERHAIPFLDFADLIHDGGGTGLYIDHVHFGKAGNDIIATGLTKFLLDSPVFDTKLRDAGFSPPPANLAEEPDNSPWRSEDAAIVLELSAGAYTVHLNSNDAPSKGLVEIWDIDPESAASRIVNISTRARVDADDARIDMDFTVTEPGRFAVGGLGQGLISHGIPSELQPSMALYDVSGKVIAGNEDSEENGELKKAPHSSNVSFFVNLDAGEYSVHMKPKEAGGIGLAGITNPGSGHFTKIRSRAHMGTGLDVMAVGLIVEGEGIKKIAIRGSSSDNDPYLEVHDVSGKLIASNDNRGAWTWMSRYTKRKPKQ